LQYKLILIYANLCREKTNLHKDHQHHPITPVTTVYATTYITNFFGKNLKTEQNKTVLNFMKNPKHATSKYEELNGNQSYPLQIYHQINQFMHHRKRSGKKPLILLNLYWYLLKSAFNL
jgi:hypothetical protein